MINTNMSKLCFKLQNKIIDYGLLFCVTITFIFSFAFIKSPLELDELFAVYNTSADLSLLQVIYNASIQDTWPPFYYILLHYVQVFFGDSEISLRLPSVLFHTASIIVVYFFTKSIYSKKEALLASILLTFCGFTLWYSIEIRGYSLYLLLSISSLYFLYKLINNSSSFIYYAIPALLCTLTHFFGLLLVIFQIMFLSANMYVGNKLSKKLMIQIILFCILISIYPIVNYFLQGILYNSDFFNNTAAFNNSFCRNTFIVQELLPKLFFNLKIAFLLFFITLYFFCIFQKKDIFILFFAVIPLLFANCFAYFGITILEVQYFIFIFPLTYVLAAHFLNEIIKPKYFIVTIMILFILLAYNLKNVDMDRYQDKTTDVVENIYIFKDKSTNKKSILTYCECSFLNYYINKFDFLKEKTLKLDHNRNISEQFEYFLKNNYEVYYIKSFTDLNCAEHLKKTLSPDEFSRIKCIYINYNLCKIIKADTE